MFAGKDVKGENGRFLDFTYLQWVNVYILHSYFRASYIEIYNEKINDLLERGKASLKLRESTDGSVIICELKEEVVNTVDKVI